MYNVAFCWLYLREFLVCMGGFSWWIVSKMFTRPHEQSYGIHFDVWWHFDSRYKIPVTSICSEQQDAMCFYHVQLLHTYCFVKQQMMRHALWKQILCMSTPWQYAKKRIRIYNMCMKLLRSSLSKKVKTDELSDHNIQRQLKHKVR